MIGVGILLFFSGLGLILFRTPLAGTRVGDGDVPFSIYVVNQSGETTLLWIGGLICLLGIGLIVGGLIRPNRHVANSLSSKDPRNRPIPTAAPDTSQERVYCSICKVEVTPDDDHRCPLCGWST